MREILQDNWCEIFKNIEVIKDKDRLKNYFRLKKMKETSKVKGTHYPGLQPEIEEKKLGCSMY